MNIAYSSNVLAQAGRNMKRCMCAVAALFLFVGSPKMFGNEKTVRVTIENSGSTVTIHPGDLLEVTLPATFGTGYSWRLKKTAENVLTASGGPETKHSESGRKTGQTEYQVFHFVTSAKGTGQLELEYVQPWEKDAKPAKLFQLNIEVQ
jgi:predicted secreted protein